MERKRPGLGWESIRRAVASDHGAAVPEYVAFLGIIVSALAIGAAFLGTHANQAVSRLAETGIRDRMGAPRAAVTKASSDDLSPDSTAPPGFVDRHMTAVLVIAVGGMGLVTVGMLLERRGRKRTALSVEEPEVDAPPRDPANSRLQGKRWWLWHTLINDSQRVLQNRVEVQHLMTRETTVVAPSATVAEMRDLIDLNRIRHLLVCDGNNRLLGVISDRDLRAAEPGKKAHQVMTADPCTVSPSTLVSAAITCMTNESISCLPVVEDGSLRGLLTTTDLVLTLQCMLQLWLRLGDSVRESPEWAKHIEAISAAVDQSLAV